MLRNRNQEHVRGRLTSLASRAGTLLVGTSLVLSQAMPTCLPTVAYAEEATAQASDGTDGKGTSDKNLYALWDDVLDATDAEAEARASLNAIQDDVVGLSERMEDIQSRIDSLGDERKSLTQSISDLVDFANSPSTGNKAYTDAVLAVVDALEATTEADEALSAAKSDYATARQRLADLNAKLSASDDGAAMEAAKAELERTEEDIQRKSDARVDAEKQLSEASEQLAKALDGANGESKKAYEKMQDDFAAKQQALEKATSQREGMEQTVADDRKSLAEQGANPPAYSMSDLGTPGEYMDGIDISTYQDGIDLSKVPVDFVIVKATEGPNPLGEWCVDDYQSKVDQALANDKCVGLYHFYSTNETPEAQAKRFVEESKDYIGKVAFFLDWESRTYNGGWGGYGDSPVATLDPSVAKAWLDTVYELTGTKPGIYMSRSVTAMHDWSEVAAEYPLWVAAYPSTESVDGYTQEYKEPYGGSVGAWGEGPLIWQYSSTTYLANWGGRLDVNVMYGTRDDWAKLVGQNWEAKLKKDEEQLAKATSAEESAQTAYDDAKKAADEASASIRSQSDELDGAFSLVSERESLLSDAKASVDEANAKKAEQEAALAEIEGRNTELLKGIEEAQAALDKASETVSASQAAVEKAQADYEMSQHKKDMFKRIFDIVNADATDSTTSDAKSGESDKGNGQGVDGMSASDASATEGEPEAAADTNPVTDAISYVLGTVAGALSPTVAVASPSNGSLTAEALPAADVIINDPSVLDPFIDGADDDNVKELLADIKADAKRVSEIDIEMGMQSDTYKRLEQDLAMLDERVVVAEGAVATAQSDVESARQAYQAQNPDGTAEAPAGYVDNRKIPDTGLRSNGAEDRSLVTLWVDMFALAIVITVIFVFIEERRQGRRKAHGERG